MVSGKLINYLCKNEYQYRFYDEVQLHQIMREGAQALLTRLVMPLRMMFQGQDKTYWTISVDYKTFAWIRQMSDPP